jgi:hypothetical protein
MENLAIVDKISFKDGELIPCVRILRGLDIATKQQGAKFVLVLNFTYPSGGRDVSTGDVTTSLKDNKGLESRDPMWQRFIAPKIRLDSPPDDNARFTCKATITITGVTGIPTPCSDLDTAFLELS